MVSTSSSARAEGRLSPARIRLARQRACLTKAALARDLGITSRTLQTYEVDGAPAARVQELAAALGVDPRFLQRDDRDAIAVEQGNFRALRRATAAQLGAARAWASVGMEVYEWLESRLTLPPVQLPELDHEDPQSAAAALRALWGRGSEPIANLLQLCEANGVRVMSLPAAAQAVDAFSLWQDQLPYVYLSTAKTAERSRFDLAHELGHLVMHSHTPAVDIDDESRSSRDLEREADAFAASFLMPRDKLAAVAGREPAVPHILRLRSHYRVAAMAMTYRLHVIGSLSDWSYRQACMQLAQRGFRSSEPGGIKRELSRVFALAFPLLREQGWTVSSIAADLGLTPTDLHALTFGQASAVLTGGAGLAGSTRPRLTLVESAVDSVS